MNMKQHWTDEEIAKFKDFMQLKGDLFVIGGQEIFCQAYDCLPVESRFMDEWCSRWLTEDRLEQILSEISHS